MYADLALRFIAVYAQTLAGLCRVCDQGGAMHPLFQMMLDRIMTEKPDCVGISLSFSQQVPVGSTLGRLLRKHDAIKVILGGSVFGDSAEEFMRSIAATSRSKRNLWSLIDRKNSAFLAFGR